VINSDDYKLVFVLHLILIVTEQLDSKMWTKDIEYCSQCSDLGFKWI